MMHRLGLLFILLSPTARAMFSRNVTVCAHAGCVSWDPCQQRTDAGLALAARQWHHRSSEALVLPHEQLNESAVAHHFASIRNFSVPPGIHLQACEPDFYAYRSQQTWECYPKSIRTWSCSAETCVVHVDSNKVQMLWYDFVDGWGCFNALDVNLGTRLNEIVTPNQLLPCFGGSGDRTYTGCSSLIECCVFACQHNLVPNASTGECQDPCYGFQAACPNSYHATETCAAAPEGVTLYECTPCAPVAGHFAVWSAAEPGQCRWEPCAPGTFESAGVCLPCPANTLSGNASVACTPCPNGYQAPGSADRCEDCLTALPETPQSSACAPGSVPSLNRTAVEAFLHGADGSAAAEIWRRACEQAYACVPCFPGTYYANASCEPCPVGSFQSAFGQDTCHTCPDGSTTAQAGADSLAKCVCDLGFATGQ